MRELNLQAEQEKVDAVAHVRNEAKTEIVKMRDKIQEVNFTWTNGNFCETNFAFSMSGGSVCQRLERLTCNLEALGSSRVLAARWIGHFRVALNLCFKARQIAKPLA